MDRVRLVDVVDAAYASDASGRLGNVLELARACFPRHLGVAGFRFERTGAVAPVEVHEDPALRGGVSACFRAMGTKVTPAFRAVAHANLATDVAWDARESLPTELRDVLDRLGLENLLGVLARPNETEGIWIGCGLTKGTEEVALARHVREWRLVAKHLCLAMHTDSLGIAEFDTRGRGDFGAVPRADREALITRAQHAARLRDSAGRDADALGDWAAIASGRYTLVRRVMREGGVRFIAVEADSPLMRARRLTKAEATTLERVALGHTNKVIAMELGVSEPRIATRVKRAMHKLGVTHRAELVQLVDALTRRD